MCLTLFKLSVLFGMMLLQRYSISRRSIHEKQKKCIFTCTAQPNSVDVDVHYYNYNSSGGRTKKLMEVAFLECNNLNILFSSRSG